MLAVRLDVTTNADGDGEATAALAGMYLLHAVEWIDGDFADGVDAVLSVTGTPSGVASTLLTLTDANSDAWYYPRAQEQTTEGADFEDAVVTTQLVVAGDLNLVVSNGGDSKSGGCVVYLREA